MMVDLAFQAWLHRSRPAHSTAVALTMALPAVPTDPVWPDPARARSSGKQGLLPWALLERRNLPSCLDHNCCCCLAPPQGYWLTNLELSVQQRPPEEAQWTMVGGLMPLTFRSLLPLQHVAYWTSCYVRPCCNTAVQPIGAQNPHPLVTCMCRAQACRVTVWMQSCWWLRRRPSQACLLPLTPSLHHRPWKTCPLRASGGPHNCAACICVAFETLAWGTG